MKKEFKAIYNYVKENYGLLVAATSIPGKELVIPEEISALEGLKKLEYVNAITGDTYDFNRSVSTSDHIRHHLLCAYEITVFLNCNFNTCDFTDLFEVINVPMFINCKFTNCKFSTDRIISKVSKEQYETAKQSFSDNHFVNCKFKYPDVNKAYVFERGPSLLQCLAISGNKDHLDEDILADVFIVEKEDID